MLVIGVWMVGDRRCVRKICPCVKWRINVDEIYLAGILRHEGGEDVFVVAPDEAVAPFGLAAGGEEFEVAAAVLRGLVDGFDGLKGEGNANGALLFAVGVVFAVPDEFGQSADSSLRSE